jgi:hypothetical protein
VTNRTGLFAQAEKSTNTEIAVCGYFTQAGSFNLDAAVAKIDLASGTVAWGNAYGSAGSDLAAGIDVDGSGNVVFTGHTQADSLVLLNGGVPTDIYYVKTDPSGSVACNVSPLTITSVNFPMLDSVSSIIVTDITSSSYIGNYSPVVSTLYSDTTACVGVGTVETVPTVFNFQVYPNPADHFVVIDHASSEKYKMIIFDMTGKEMLNSELRGKNAEIDVSTIENGIYFVQFISGNNIKVEKIMIQH